jgi:hypothetical protein
MEESGLHYPGACLDGLRKATENLYEDNQSLGRDSNPGHAEYEAGKLATRP